MAKQSQQMSAEETLSRLSQQVKFTMEFTIKPTRDPKPTPKVIKRKKAALAMAKAVGRATGRITLPQTEIPSFTITGKTKILGRVLKETYERVLPDNVESTKHEIQSRFNWYIRNLYLSKDIACGTTSVECAVDLKP